MKKRINVTQRDIEKGVATWASSCPIAIAAKRTLKYPVLVSRTHITLKHDTVSLPSDACAFVHAFDHHEPVAPFHFEIEVPS